MKKNTENITTNTLTDILKTKHNLDSFYKEYDTIASTPESVSDYFTYLLRHKNMSRAEVIIGANLSKTHGYDILNGKKSPSRDKAIRICFALGLNKKETDHLLSFLNVGALYVKVPRDMIIVHSILHSKTLAECNEQLRANGFPELADENLE